MTSFLPPGFDPGDLKAIEERFLHLEGRSLDSVAALESFLLDESTLHAHVTAEVARRYIRMTCHTNDTEARERFLAHEREVVPRVKVLGDRLDRHFLAAPALEQLGKERYGLMIKKRRAAREIFRAENTALQTQESELQTKQQEIMGSLVVRYEGKEHTVQQMAPFQESQDRAVREAAWRAVIDTRRASWPELETIYDELVALRTRIAANAGFATYTPYRFRELQRFDYAPETCRLFHRAVELAVVPAVVRLDAARKRKLGVERLRPWDLEVDPDGAPPLRPFATEAELVALVKRIFAQVDPRFVTEFEMLEKGNLLDLMSRKGKAPGGYQYTLEDVRMPFVFANAVGVHHDVQTLLHEGGHAFHALLAREEPLLTYRESPIEFAETASMSMELMGLERLAGVYAPADVQRVQKKHLEGILRILTWIATIDAFQHWVYDHPGHSHAERQAEWIALGKRFSPSVDYTGCEDALAYLWTKQPHLFLHPFYYIEYGIAQIAALQVWRRFRTDPEGAVASYRSGLSLGGAKPLPALFAATGVRFDVGEGMLRELVGEIEKVL